MADLGLALPPGEAIGEAVVTGSDAVVAGGGFAGVRLGSLVKAGPRGILGELGLEATAGRALFPVLVKLIDAAQQLSIQVHPHDAAAAPLDRLGKTEVYHVLAADPEAEIGLGLRAGVTVDEFATACRRGGGKAAELVRWLPAVPSTTIIIPAGTVHALGAGCLVYEVQQPSDITYRFDDGGRLDDAGKPRELHVDEGLAVLDACSRPEVIEPLAVPTGAGRRHLCAACSRFALERIALARGEEVPLRAAASAQAVTCLRGAVAVASDAGEAMLNLGETAIAGAGALGLRMRALAPAVALRSWVPNLRVDVISPAGEAGYSDAAIVGLSGPLPDLRRVLGATF